MMKKLLCIIVMLVVVPMLFATKEQYQLADRQGILWDFETGWQGWTHTSGLTFPAAWDVHTTSYPGGTWFDYLPPPDAGDSAFIIDSDSAGSGGIWVHDTAMSPVIPNLGYTTLKWGYYIEDQYLSVLLREYDGGWQPWNIVAQYGVTSGPAWDSVDITSYTGDSLQVGFRYDDGASWRWGATFDNVGLYMSHDVGPISIDIISPLPWNTTIPPEATVKNFGNVMQTFDVTCEIAPGGYSSTETVTDLAAGASIQVTFTPDFTFATEDTYTVTVYTELGTDMDPMNDTLVAYIETYDPGIAEDGSLPEVFSSSVSSITNGLVTIQFGLPTRTTVELTVYDALGRMRETLVSDTYSAGTHRVDVQLNVPAGVYFYRMETGLGMNTNGKIILVD